MPYVGHLLQRAAEGWYPKLETPVVAYERLGGRYEEMGRPEDADAGLEPRVEAARERARQLGGTAR